MGLAAPCDQPAAEAAVRDIFTKNLKDPGMLPFVGVLTHDLKWVHGFSGFRDVEQFAADLEAVEKSPALDAAPDVVKKLEKIAALATKAAEKEQWKKVLECEDEAAELTGRHAFRETIDTLAAKARAAAEKVLADTVASLRGGGDRAEGKKALMALARDFRGRPHGEEAQAGIKALDRLARFEDLEGDALESARGKAAEEYAGTRWAALFQDGDGASGSE